MNPNPVGILCVVPRKLKEASLVLTVPALLLLPLPAVHLLAECVSTQRAISQSKSARRFR